jgi:hypothetical protein
MDDTAGSGQLTAQRRGPVVLIVVAALVVAAGGIGVNVLRRHRDPAPGQTLAAVKYISRLHQVGAPVPLTGDGGAIAAGHAFASLTADGHALAVVHAEDGTVWVSELDLATGRPAWPDLDLGRWKYVVGSALTIARGIIVSTQQDDGDDAPLTTTVIDPGSGRVRWSVAGVVPAASDEDVVVFRERSTSTLRGIDAITGAMRWTMTIPAGVHAAVVSPFGAGRAFPPALFPYSASPAAASDHRLFMVDPGGAMTTYDMSTGEQIERRPGLMPAAANAGLFVLRGALYALSTDRVDMIDLAGNAPMRTVYTATSGRHVVEVNPCGPAGMCVQTDDGSGGSPVIEVIDLATGKRMWLSVEQSAGVAWSVGSRILTPDAGLYDVSGIRLLAPSGSTAAFVAPNRALLLHSTDGPPFDRAADAVEAFLVATDTGELTDLGAFNHLIGGCMVDSKILVCPLATGLQAWRFP